jgi:hypothetical protein
MFGELARQSADVTRARIGYLCPVQYGCRVGFSRSSRQAEALRAVGPHAGPLEPDRWESFPPGLPVIAGGRPPG